MSNLEKDQKDGYINITGNDAKQKITYSTSDIHRNSKMEKGHFHLCLLL